MRLPLFLAVTLACAGCGTALQPYGMIAHKTTDWHRAVTENDRARLRDWRATFVTAVAAARKAGFSSAVDREGVLLDPDAALTNPALPDGMYSCRVIKLGAKAAGNLNYIAYPNFACEARSGQMLQHFAKLSGSQRQVGVIFPADALRGVFLGTLVLGDETRAFQYGQDETRDVAGFVERIGPNRWRLIIPKPHYESQLDVMELVPTTAGAR